MNGLEKPFRKKSDPKNRENSKYQSEVAACEQKTTTEKQNFCSNTIFSLYFNSRTMSELRKPFLKKIRSKNKKKKQNQCQNAACEQKTTSKK